MSVVQAKAEHKADQRRVWVVFSGLMLGLLIASLDQAVVATALPTIVSDLGGLNQLSWVRHRLFAGFDCFHTTLGQAR